MPSRSHYRPPADNLDPSAPHDTEESQRDGTLAVALAEALAPIAATIVTEQAVREVASHPASAVVASDSASRFDLMLPHDADVGHVDREPEVGMGVTVLGWAGRFAATIVHVNRPKTKIIVQRDRVTMHASPMCNSLQYESDPCGITTTFTKRRNGAWIREKKYFGNGITELWVGTRRESTTIDFRRA